MRNFPAAFTTEKNKLLGAAPVWVLKMTVANVTYYLSGNQFSIAPWGVTTKAWVKSWGTLQEGMGGTLDEFRISDFTVDLLSDPDASPSMVQLATQNELEESTVSLYLWFYGCSDPPQEMFRGYVKDVDIPDEDSVNLTLQDESLRLERAMIGRRVTLDVYPAADKDDVGKVIPVVLGSVQKLPALAIDAGFLTSLAASMSDTATLITVSDPTGISAGMTLWADQEKLYVSSLAGAALTVIRGYGGTTAVPHDKASVVWEDKSEFVYAAADRAVSAIPKVWGMIGSVMLDITAICTRYPAGNHPRYPGLAVVSVPGYVTAAQAVALGIDPSDFTISLDGATVASLIDLIDPGHAHYIGTTSTESATTTLPTTLTLKGNYVSGTFYGITGNPNVWYIRVDFPNDGARTDATYHITLNFAQTSNGVPFYVVINGVVKYTVTLNTVSGSAYILPPISAGSADVDYILVCSTGFDEAHYQVTVATRTIILSGTGSTLSGTGINKSGSGTAIATKGGAIEVTGNSVANTLVGDEVLCDVASGVTSRAAACGLILSDAGFTGTLQETGAWPASYVVNGAITEYKSALYWLNEIAFECRAWFKLAAGVARFIYRPGTVTSAKSLAACRESGGKKVWSRKKTVYDEILNTVQVLYARDWTQTKGDGAYAAAASGSDAPSILKYGPRERPGLFQFDFVTDPDMATDLLSFYLGWYKVRHWLHSFDTFLYDAELEFVDGVTLAFASGEVGQVLETQASPGDHQQSDTIGMVVVV